MYKRFLVLLLLAVYAFSACVDTPQANDHFVKMSFDASIASGDTKTVLVDRTHVYWQDGDKIAVSGAASPFITSLAEDSPTASFTGEAPEAEVYYSVSPYEAVQEWADELVLLNLQKDQPAVKGTFASDINIAVASTTSQDKDFFFRNVLAYIKLSVGSGAGRINSITISTPAGEALTGSFYVDCSEEDPVAVPDEEIPTVTLTSETVFEEGDYYLAIIPGTYSEGLTFTFEGPGGTAVRSIERSLTIGRGTVYALPLDDLEWQAGEAYYAKVDQTYDDWSGEYLVTYSSSSSIAVFNSFDGSDKGTSSVDLASKLTSEGIPAEDGDPYKAVVKKVGDNYSINITGVGYIGLESSSNKVNKSDVAPSSSDTKYLWKFSYYNGKVELANASFTSRYLLWNASASCFRCYTGSQKSLTLYKRTVSGNSVKPTPTPEPDPTPDPEPEPEPDPTPDPEPGEDEEIPEPVPGMSGKYGWYELPQISYTQSGNYLIDSNDKNLYYAHHICAGKEKGPGGKTARNYTVCFSAEHHCPVWVAAPRHKMYQSGADRTDAYAKDPSIPSDIQYNSKSTGGGCNKGHMLGSAERISTTATNKQVFYYSNIAPQYSNTFNTGGGGWNILEDWVDGQVCSDTLYVVIGAYFDEYTDRRGYTDSPATISYCGRNDVHRPTMFYYILLRTKSGSSGKPLSQCTASELKCAAFVRSHKTPKSTYVSEKDLMSVSDLEKITGFTYFPNVPQAPKDSYKASDWGL